MINVIAFLCGFITAFRHKKDEIIQCGKTTYIDGVPVTGIVKGEK